MMNPTGFLNEVNQELRKVSWPSRQQTLQMTGLVIFVSILVSLYIGSLDFIFQQLLSWVVG
jgi:preprotein translocase subunit SecE